MDYAYYDSQSQPYQFGGAFPPAPVQSYEAQDDQQQQSTNATNIYNTAATAGINDFYDQRSYQFTGNGFVPQGVVPQPQPPTQLPQHPHQHPPPQPSPTELDNHQPSISSVVPDHQALNGFQPSPPSSNDVIMLAERPDSRSDSEDKETLTPQQSRRKEQNRAAQRAFRERKERHVKELEAKLNSLSAHSSSLLSDNERLKRELQRYATQNEILRATNAQSQHSGGAQHPRSPSPVHGPQTYSPTDFNTAVGLDSQQHPVSYDHYDGEEGQKLLGAGATWDLIQSHELFRRGMVDIADVSRRLKGKAACSGRGPAFREKEIIKAIEESVISGSDELI